MKCVHHLRWLALYCCGALLTGGAVLAQDEQTEKANPLKITFDEIAKKLGRFKDSSRHAPEFERVFLPLSASVAPSTVQLWANDRQIMLGTVIDSSGLILTKASELKSPLECRLENGNKLNTQVIGIDTETDLALLKVDADALTPAKLQPVPPPSVGSWLATIGPEPKPLTLGMVGVKEREIAHARAYIGIMPVDFTDRDGVRINQITAGAPADSADLRVNDVILKINEQETKKVSDLRAILATQAPGDRIELTVQRGESTFTVNIELANMENIDPDFERSNQQNRMGSTLSKRRQDFPLAFQHDAGVQANQCGSPLVDSNGQIVGINISRSGRVSTLALPMEVVLPAIERLRSGTLAPAVIYKSRLEQIEKELAGLTARLAELPQQLAAAESKAAGDDARKAEVQRMADELKARLDEIDRTTAENAAEVKRVRDELKALERKQKKLLEEQQDLTLEGNRK
jgi:S1-C subfamily serine protease